MSIDLYEQYGIRPPKPPEAMTPEQQEVSDLYSQFNVEPPWQPETVGEGMGVGIWGRPEAAAMVASGAVGQIAGGFTGAVAAPFVGPEGANEILEGVSDALTYEPITEEGQYAARQLDRAAQAFEEATGLGEWFESISTEIGDWTMDSFKSPELAALGYSVPTALVEFGGGVAYQLTKQMSKTYQATRAAFEARLPIEELADKRLGPGGIVVQDPVGLAAINQGFERGDIASLKMASPEDKRILLSILEKYRQGRQNRETQITDPSSSVFGGRVQARVEALRDINQEAAKSLDDIAKQMQGTPVAGVDQMVQDFYLDLANEFNVSRFKQNKKTGMYEIDFDMTDLNAFGGSKRILQAITQKLQRTDLTDPYELHKLKRHLDNFVNYDKKGGSGVDDTTAKFIKKLRHQIDQRLDSQFEDYKNVNDILSQSINIADRFSKYMGDGKRFSLDDPLMARHLGSVFRKISSNYGDSTGQLADLGSLERFLKEQGVEFPDNVLKQHILLSALYRVVGSEKPNSLQGTMQGMFQGDAVQMPSLTQVGTKVVSDAFNRLQGRNPEAALQAIEDLLTYTD